MKRRPPRSFVPYAPVTLRTTKYTHLLHSELLGTEKVCRACGESWPLDVEFFQPRPDHSDGYANCCKDCASKQRAEQRRRASARQCRADGAQSGATPA